MTERVKEKGSLKRTLKNLITLVVMQLKEKMDLSYLGNFRKTLFKAVYFAIEFIVVTVLCYFLFYFCKVFKVFSLADDVPVSVVSLIFTLMLSLSVIFGTVGLVKALYLSRDNLVLLTFPASSSTIFLSKIIVYYIYELRKNFMFLIPFFVGYGVAQGFKIYYYGWILLTFLFVSLLPVLISALVSIPALFIYQGLKRVKALQYAVVTLGVLAIVGGVYYLISLIPQDINLQKNWGSIYWEIQGFLDGYTNAFALLSGLTELIVGKRIGTTYYIFNSSTLLYFGILAGTLILLTALCFLLSKPLFYKMASTPFEFKKKNELAKRKNVVRSPFISAVRKEISVGLRNNEAVNLFVLLVIIQPLAVELLNKLYSAMNTRFIGMQMTIAFNLLIVLLINLSSNITVASVYSRDGAASYLNKVQPSAYGTLLVSKIVINILVGFLGVVATTVIFGVFYTEIIGLPSVILFGVTVYSLFLAHLFWSAEMDIMKPQYEQYATFSEQANNPNENLSAILCFLISFIAFGIIMFLSLEGTFGAWIKICVLGIIFAVIKISSYFTKIGVFYVGRE